MQARYWVVVWSAQSVESDWLRSEVEEGVRCGMLMPESVMPPSLPPAPTKGVPILVLEGIDEFRPSYDISDNGTQLLFVEGESKRLMAADLSSTHRFNSTPAEPILDVSHFIWNAGPRDARNFDSSPDGERFLMVRENH
jgi:hypothetical protein